jgi:large-conductance mechanosensitive channel
MIQDTMISVLGWAPLFIILCLFIVVAQYMTAGSAKQARARMEESINDQKEVLAVLKEIRDLLKKSQT